MNPDLARQMEHDLEELRAAFAAFIANPFLREIERHAAECAQGAAQARKARGISPEDDQFCKAQEALMEEISHARFFAGAYGAAAARIGRRYAELEREQSREGRNDALVDQATRQAGGLLRGARGDGPQVGGAGF